MVAVEVLRVGITGGRAYQDQAKVYQSLDRLKLFAKNKKIVIVHGCARGADSLAGSWAKERGVDVDEHPADWDQHGKRAGPIRNQEMLDSGLNQLVAFPGGTGTEDMTTRCEKANVPVWWPCGEPEARKKRREENLASKV
jgi:hypothetical protein